MHLKMTRDPIQTEKTKENSTCSSEMEILIERIEDPLMRVEESESLVCSSIYDSLVLSGYESSIYDGTSNVSFGINHNCTHYAS